MEKEQYIAIPIWFIKLTSNRKSPSYLTPFERELYWLIRGLCKNEDCYANDQYFSNIFNVTIKHINKSIHKLELLKMLYVNHKNNKRYLRICLIDRGSLLFSWDEKKTIIKVTSEYNVYEYSWEDWWDKTDEESVNYDKDFYDNMV